MVEMAKMPATGVARRIRSRRGNHLLVQWREAKTIEVVIDEELTQPSATVATASMSVCAAVATAGTSVCVTTSRPPATSATGTAERARELGREMARLTTPIPPQFYRPVNFKPSRDDKRVALKWGARQHAQV